jgi:hypothetical protein
MKFSFREAAPTRRWRSFPVGSGFHLLERDATRWQSLASGDAARLAYARLRRAFHQAAARNPTSPTL